MLSPSSGTPSWLYACNSLLTHLPFFLTLRPTFTRQLWNMNESTALPAYNIQWLSRHSGQAAKSLPGLPRFPFLPVLCAPVTLAPHSSEPGNSGCCSLGLECSPALTPKSSQAGHFLPTGPSCSEGSSLTRPRIPFTVSLCKSTFCFFPSTDYISCFHWNLCPKRAETPCPYSLIHTRNSA